MAASADAPSPHAGGGDAAGEELPLAVSRTPDRHACTFSGRHGGNRRAGTFHGHSGGGTVVMGGGRKGVWGKPGTGAVVFRGRGRFRVSPSAIPIGLTPSVCAEWSWSDPDLTLGAPRGGGEVGITEAQRSDPSSLAGRGARPNRRAQRRLSGQGTMRPMCWTFRASTVPSPGAWSCLTAVAEIPRRETEIRCEKFLYGFKAARRAARAAASAHSPTLPLTLPLRRAPTARGWREKHGAADRSFQEISGRGVSMLPRRGCPGPVRTHQGRLWPQGNRTRRAAWCRYTGRRP